MAPEYLGRGEARRSMDLLWGRSQPATRGPKAALDLQTVVRAAIELADAEGIGAISMRRVAERLEMGTMSLYTYVPGKAELLDLMVDTVNGERADDVAIPADSGLRARLEALARELWAFYERHPWTLSIASGRSVLGPNEAEAYERALSVVAHTPIPARDAVAIVDAISMFVRGAARDAAEAAGAEAATGKTEMEWWTERDAYLGDVMTPERFPTLTRLGAGGGFDVPPDAENYNVRFILDDFEFGLQRLLDGVAELVERSGRRPERRRRG